MANFTMPNSISSKKYALKAVPGLDDVGVPHGDGDWGWPQSSTQMSMGVWKNFQMSNFMSLQ